MNINLNNKVALITGSSHGIGKNIASQLAESGAKVILCARNKKKLLETQIEFNSKGLDSIYYEVDVKDPKAVAQLFEKCFSAVPKLDILVNNVGGVEKFGSFDELSPEDWKDTLDLNLMSMVYFCQNAIPLLKKSRQGRIINISSVPAIQPGFFNPHYSAAKAAMVNLSKHLSNLLAKENILVNTICPSTLSGGGWEKNIINKSEKLGISISEAEHRMLEEEGKKVPLGRVGSLNDVGNLVTFLCSDNANFITGELITVDGGTVRSAF